MGKNMFHLCICWAKAKYLFSYSIWVLSVFLSHLSHEIHSQPPMQTLPASTLPLFSAFPPIHTHPPPTFPASFSSFFIHSCCLNCLSGSIRLSKQRCYTVPACYKYLWCVSPFTPPPNTPLPLSHPSEILSSPFFLFLPFFLKLTGRNCDEGTQWQRMREGEKCSGRTNTMSSLLQSLCHYVPLREVTEERADRFACVRLLITHLWIPPFLREQKTTESVSIFWLSGEKHPRLLHKAENNTWFCFKNFFI